jgi:hypothetical protein
LIDPIYLGKGHAKSGIHLPQCHPNHHQPVRKYHTRMIMPWFPPRSFSSLNQSASPRAPPFTMLHRRAIMSLIPGIHSATREHMHATARLQEQQTVTLLIAHAYFPGWLPARSARTGRRAAPDVHDSNRRRIHGCEAVTATGDRAANRKLLRRAAEQQPVGASGHGIADGAGCDN